MSTSTLPKSIQAQMVDSGDGAESSGSQNRLKDFIEKYKTLPSDFLRIPFDPQDSYNNAVSQITRGPLLPRDTPLIDMVDISVVEAQLFKNYGLLRMDLYCKIRVGHMVCETQTCLNGAKNPKWDGVYQFNIKPGIDSFHLEIYDENQFKMDEKIAWLYEPLPSEIFQGITVERWFPLSGRQGPNKEGSVLLVISHKRVPMRSSNIGRSVTASHPHGAPLTVFVPAANQAPVLTNPTMMPGMEHQLPQGIPAYIQPLPSQQQQQQPPQTTGANAAQHLVEPPEVVPVRDEDVNQLSEMFPSIDKAIIRAVLENNHNNKEAAIGALLALG